MTLLGSGNAAEDRHAHPPICEMPEVAQIPTPDAGPVCIGNGKLIWLDYEDRPDHPFVHFNIGMTFHYCGDHENAVKWMRQSIELAKADESHVRKAYSLMGVSLRELGRVQEALAAFDEGVAAVGNDPELQFNAGIVLHAMGRSEEALTRYASVSPLEGSFFSSMDPAIFGPKLDHNAGEVLRSLGRYREAAPKSSQPPTGRVHMPPQQTSPPADAPHNQPVGRPHAPACGPRYARKPPSGLTFANAPVGPGQSEGSGAWL